MTVGNALDATGALNFFKATEGMESSNDEFRFLGGGCYRNAYLHIASQVVYKVVRTDRAQGMGNVGEFNTINRVAAMEWSNLVRIPKANLHHIIGAPVRQPILSMEFIEGTIGGETPDPYGHPGRAEFVSKSDTWDMHPYNFLISSDNRFVPIDLGCEGW